MNKTFKLKKAPFREMVLSIIGTLAREYLNGKAQYD
jgi:hypothetical protein